MERREFLRYGAVSAAAVGLAGCTSSAVNEPQEEQAADDGGSAELAQEAQGDSSLPELEWEMPTSWPLGLDTIFGGAQVFAERVSAMTGGRFKINPRAAGELVPALEVLNAVESGGAPIGHTAAYYYTGRSPVMGIGTALPFGLTYRQQNAWLYEGGGLEMLREYYADKFNVIQFPAGNTGVQMGGWFNKEINGIGDLRGLTMRIPGLGGEVMTRLGATVQVIAGGEIFQALDTNAIDAAEWVGPYDDEKLGLQNAARFYYYPGWWEPAPTLEVQMSLDEWNKLPSIYKEIVETAGHQANQIMMARYDTLNPEAVERIRQAGTELRPFPDDVLTAAEEASFALYEEFAGRDADFKAIYDSWVPFREQVQSWHAMGEFAMLRHQSQTAAGGS